MMKLQEFLGINPDIEGWKIKRLIGKMVDHGKNNALGAAYG